MSTRVYLPRFQYEDNPELPIHKRQLLWRAPERRWVDIDEWDRITRPVTITDERHINLKNKNWWGVAHHRRVTISLGQLFDSPFDENPFRLYRTVTQHHEYIWDQQAISGRATEVVLQRLAGPDGFTDQAAMLRMINRQNDGAEHAQRMLINSEAGWVEPEYTGIDDRRDFCLLVMSELAVATHEDPLPLSIRGASATA